MKKFLLFLLMAVTLAACKSNEQKAMELIDKRMFNTLFDYASYEPINTIVEEGYSTIYIDATIREHAVTAQAASKLTNESLEEASSALEYAKIYSDSYYGSGLKKYEEYLDKAKSSREKVNYYFGVWQNAEDSIKICVNRFNPQFLGWEVKHKFRVKSKGGNYNLANYVFIIDKDFKNIISEFDIDDDDEIAIRARIDYAIGENED